ncbi:arylesterase [Pseudoruegeria sp. HB172150]|uniref:arylesterase n=1 Tax=Pseudoruegeria sp. HB172150 TaxID=2721164 RepID=UPI0015543775|nr:arylesterase [Pseudoruegeria sp. HB172150]
MAYGAGREVRNLGLALVLLAGPAAAEPVVIAALGDSLTAGYGLPPENGFVPQLQAWLTGHGADVELRNAGVSGDTTQGGLSRIGWVLADDVDAMVLALGANDMLRGIDPSVARGNLDGILSAAQEAGVEVLVIGIAAPANYGADYQTEFNAIYPDLVEEYGALHGPDFLAPLLEKAQGSNIEAYLQADHLHPNAEGVKVIVEGLGPSVLELIDRVE